MHRSLVRTSAFVVVGMASSAALADPLTRAPHGWFLGADAGVAWLLGGTDVTAHATSSSGTDTAAWCFAGRVGYEFASGLAVQARFDNLGVESPDDSSRLLVASAGIRYSIPIVPMPFAEALVGPMFHGSSASATVGLGIGASLFVARHVGFDVALRDWIFDLDGVRDVPAVMLGMSAGFGG